MRGKDKDASALAPAAICRKPLRGSFMTLPDELECLRKWRWHLQTKYRRIARPPKIESLPLISGNVGMFRGQLCDKDTLIPFSQGGVQCRPLARVGKCRHCSLISVVRVRTAKSAVAGDHFLHAHFVGWQTAIVRKEIALTSARAPRHLSGLADAKVEQHCHRYGHYDEH